MRFILDASFAMPFGLSSKAIASLSAAAKPVVPLIWKVEVASGYHQAYLAKRVTASDAQAALRLLQAMRVEHAPEPSPIELFKLQRRHAIGAYDAVYVGAAMALNLKIATLDLRLIRNLKNRGLDYLVLPHGSLPSAT